MASNWPIFRYIGRYYEYTPFALDQAATGVHVHAGDHVRDPHAEHRLLEAVELTRAERAARQHDYMALIPVVDGAGGRVVAAGGSSNGHHAGA